MDPALESRLAKLESSLKARIPEGDRELLKKEFLGNESFLTGELRKLGSLSIEDKKKLGPLLQTARKKWFALLRPQSGKKTSTVDDPTLPGADYSAGHHHPVLETLREVLDVFRAKGFVVREGPDIETEYYNFDALRLPPSHPARDAHDSFYIGGDLMLKTHTSPVQIRVLEAEPPPLALVAPGRCYRRDTPDTSHSPVFHQIEGLLVDREISMAQLKGLLGSFIRTFFGSRTRFRFRPDYFPFTEPSVEVAISCVICGGSGCATCKNEGFLEILGAGLVHPEILSRVKKGPWQGLAFGVGIERLTMIRYGFKDIRDFFSGHYRMHRSFPWLFS